MLGFELFKRMSEVMTRRLQLARMRLLKAYSESERHERVKRTGSEMAAGSKMKTPARGA